MYISFMCRHYRNGHVQIEQNHYDIDIQSVDYNLSREHKFSYRIFCLQKVKDLVYIFDRRNFKHLNLC
jgi:hypothetical protein